MTRNVLAAFVALMLTPGLSSCGPFLFSDPCDIAPVNLRIESVDSMRVGQTIGVQAYYDKGFLPACKGTWSSDNPGVLAVNVMSSSTSNTALGVSPGTATVKLLIGTDSAVDRVTVVP